MKTNLNVIFENGLYFNTENGEQIEATTEQEQFSLNTRILYKAETVLHFGKHRGKTIEEILNLEYSYLIWMKTKGFKFEERVYEDLIDLLDNKERREQAQYRRQVRRTSNIRVYSGMEVNEDCTQLVPAYERGLRDIKRHLDNNFFDKYGQLPFDEADITMGDL